MLVFGGVWFGFCVDYFASCLTPALRLLRLALRRWKTLGRSVEIRTADGVKHAANVPASCSDLVCFEDVRSIDSPSHEVIQAKWWANSEIASYLPNQVQVRNISTWWKGSLLTAGKHVSTTSTWKNRFVHLAKPLKTPFLSKDLPIYPDFNLLALGFGGDQGSWVPSWNQTAKGTIPALKWTLRTWKVGDSRWFSLRNDIFSGAILVSGTGRCVKWWANEKLVANFLRIIFSAN